MRKVNLLISLVLIINIVTCLPNRVVEARITEQNDEQKDWAAVISEAAQAFKILAREWRATTQDERAQLWQQRTEAFAVAQRKMGDWMRKYVADKEDSLKFLDALFRLGTYAEFAGNYFAASKYYTRIGDHPKLKDPAALFNGTSISKIGFKHLQRVTAAIQSVPLLAPGVSDDESLRPVLIAKPQALEEFRYLTNDRDVAEARLLFGFETPEQASAFGSNMLQAAGLSFKAEQRNDFIVFGIGGESKEVVALADRIAETRSLIVKTYMPATPVGPPLTIYANTGKGDPKEIMRKVSKGALTQELAVSDAFYDSLEYVLILPRKVDVANKQEIDVALRYSSLALLNLDCPGIPQYVSKGLSLAYEEVGPSGPIDNYRLYYLIEAQSAKKFPKVIEILSAKEADWSGPRKELLEAAVRYLAMFLAQHQADKNLMKSAYDKTCNRTATHNLPPPDQLDVGFKEFVAGRNVKEVDLHWGNMRESIRQYIQSLPATGP